MREKDDLKMRPWAPTEKLNYTTIPQSGLSTRRVVDRRFHEPLCFLLPPPNIGEREQIMHLLLARFCINKKWRHRRPLFIHKEQLRFHVVMSISLCQK